MRYLFSYSNNSSYLCTFRHHIYQDSLYHPGCQRTVHYRHILLIYCSSINSFKYVTRRSEGKNVWRCKDYHIYIYTNVVTLIKFLIKLTLSWAEYLELVSQPSNKKHSLSCYLYIYLPTHWLLVHFAFVLSSQSVSTLHSRSTGWFRTIYFFYNTASPLVALRLADYSDNQLQPGGGGKA